MNMTFKSRAFCSPSSMETCLPHIESAGKVHGNGYTAFMTAMVTKLETLRTAETQVARLEAFLTSTLQEQMGAAICTLCLLPVQSSVAYVLLGILLQVGRASPRRMPPLVYQSSCGECAESRVSPLVSEIRLVPPPATSQNQARLRLLCLGCHAESVLKVNRRDKVSRQRTGTHSTAAQRSQTAGFPVPCQQMVNARRVRSRLLPGVAVDHWLACSYAASPSSGTTRDTEQQGPLWTSRDHVPRSCPGTHQHDDDIAPSLCPHLLHPPSSVQGRSAICSRST